MKKGQEPAFPLIDRNLGDYAETNFHGVSTRLYIATEAMQALITQSNCTIKLTDPIEPIPSPEIIAQIAVKYADALLNEEDEK